MDSAYYRRQLVRKQEQQVAAQKKAGGGAQEGSRQARRRREGDGLGEREQERYDPSLEAARCRARREGGEQRGSGRCSRAGEGREPW